MKSRSWRTNAWKPDSFLEHLPGLILAGGKADFLTVLDDFRLQPPCPFWALSVMRPGHPRHMGADRPPGGGGRDNRQFEDRRRLEEINVLRVPSGVRPGDLGHAAALLAELRRYADQSHDAQQAWALIWSAPPPGPATSTRPRCRRCCTYGRATGRPPARRSGQRWHPLASLRSSATGWTCTPPPPRPRSRCGTPAASAALASRPPRAAAGQAMRSCAATPTSSRSGSPAPAMPGAAGVGWRAARPGPEGLAAEPRGG